jgi:hypothetical protein
MNAPNHSNSFGRIMSLVHFAQFAVTIRQRVSEIGNMNPGLASFRKKGPGVA